MYSYTERIDPIDIFEQPGANYSIHFDIILSLVFKNINTNLLYNY